MIASSSVEIFATELKVPVETLLEQLHAAGVPKLSGSDLISEEDKEKLLATLRKSHGKTDKPTIRKKITLTKRQTSEIRQADSTGKSRTIQVEVRKKRVFVKRDQPKLKFEVEEGQDLAGLIDPSVSENDLLEDEGPSSTQEASNKLGNLKEFKEEKKSPESDNANIKKNEESKIADKAEGVSYKNETLTEEEQLLLESGEKKNPKNSLEEKNADSEKNCPRFKK
jgi:translation initiation factor IF-2